MIYNDVILQRIPEVITLLLSLMAAIPIGVYCGGFSMSMMGKVSAIFILVTLSNCGNSKSKSERSSELAEGESRKELNIVNGEVSNDKSVGALGGSCSSVVISDRCILTSAHCVTGASIPSLWSDEDQPQNTFLGIKRIFPLGNYITVDPEFENSYAKNARDLALIFLDKNNHTRHQETNQLVDTGQAHVWTEATLASGAFNPNALFQAIGYGRTLTDSDPYIRRIAPHLSYKPSTGSVYQRYPAVYTFDNASASGNVGVLPLHGTTPFPAEATYFGDSGGALKQNGKLYGIVSAGNLSEGRSVFTSLTEDLTAKLIEHGIRDFCNPNVLTEIQPSGPGQVSGVRDNNLRILECRERGGDCTDDGEEPASDNHLLGEFGTHDLLLKAIPDQGAVFSSWSNGRGPDGVEIVNSCPCKGSGKCTIPKDYSFTDQFSNFSERAVCRAQFCEKPLMFPISVDGGPIVQGETDDAYTVTITDTSFPQEKRFLEWRAGGSSDPFDKEVCPCAGSTEKTCRVEKSWLFEEGCFPKFARCQPLFEYKETIITEIEGSHLNSFKNDHDIELEYEDQTRKACAHAEEFNADMYRGAKETLNKISGSLLGSEVIEYVEPNPRYDPDDPTNVNGIRAKCWVSQEVNRRIELQSWIPADANGPLYSTKVTGSDECFLAYGYGYLGRFNNIEVSLSKEIRSSWGHSYQEGERLFLDHYSDLMQSMQTTYVGTDTKFKIFQEPTYIGSSYREDTKTTWDSWVHRGTYAYLACTPSFSHYLIDPITIDENQPNAKLFTSAITSLSSSRSLALTSGDETAATVSLSSSEDASSKTARRCQLYPHLDPSEAKIFAGRPTKDGERVAQDNTQFPQFEYDTASSSWCLSYQPELHCAENYSYSVMVYSVTNRSIVSSSTLKFDCRSKAQTQADFNQDGLVDSNDLLIWQKEWRSLLPGDSNGDGYVDDQGRIDYLNNAGAKRSDNQLGDYNHDGLVNSIDYSVWKQNLGKHQFPGDSNGDFKVDQADLDLCTSQLGKTGGLIRCDFDHDREVRNSDLNIIQDNLGQEISFQADANGDRRVNLKDLEILRQTMYSQRPLEAVEFSGSGSCKPYQIALHWENGWVYDQAIIKIYAKDGTSLLVTLSTAASNGGRTIYLPPGVYKASLTLRIESGLTDPIETPESTMRTLKPRRSSGACGF